MARSLHFLQLLLLHVNSVLQELQGRSAVGFVSAHPGTVKLSAQAALDFPFTVQARCISQGAPAERVQAAAFCSSMGREDFEEKRAVHGDYP